MQRRAGDETLIGKVCRDGLAARQGQGDLIGREQRHPGGDKPIAEIAVVADVAGCAAGDGGMARQVDGIGHHRGGGIGGRGVFGQSRHSIGNAKREAAPAPAAGGQAAHTETGRQRELPEEPGLVRPTGQADGKCLAGFEMQGDITAIVDIGAGEVRRAGHGRENLVGHRPRHRSHRRDEDRLGKGGDGDLHAPRHGAHGGRRASRSRRAKKRELIGQFRQHRLETAQRRAIGGLDIGRGTKRLDDEINRPVLQMQPPAVRQHRRLRPGAHPSDRRAAWGENGQGLSPCSGSFRPAMASMEASGRTKSMWPPSAA